MPGSTAHSTLHSGRLGMCEPLSTLGRLCWLLLLLPGWLLVVGPFAVGPSAAPNTVGRRQALGQLSTAAHARTTSLTEQPCQILDRVPVGFFFH